MKKIFPLIILSILFVGCSTNNSSTEIFDGTYIGSFSRISDTGQNPSAKVSITFNNGTFEGTSTINEYPAICNGTYEISDSDITFSNSCVFTADFDWTYILNGTYTYEVIDNEFRIRKVYNFSSSDVYILNEEE